MHRGSAGRLAVVGGVAGVIAGLAMAVFVMFASATYLRLGLFTPLYAIAAPLLGDEVRQASMAEFVHWDAAAVATGLGIHMFWSVVWGAAFGFMARPLALRGAPALAVGIIYGIAVMVVMTYTVVALAGAGMVEMLGWASWTIAHVIFGFALGLWPYLRPRDVRREAEAVTAPASDQAGR